jgi:cyclic pyranopterin phosphate synthase
VPLLDLILGYDCNLACDYCTITPAMRPRALSTAQVARAMRDARARGYDRVALTGGEPTIRPDLVGLVRLARELGFVDVKVQSNGLLFAHRPNLERLRSAGASTFHLSIHTHDPARYDALVRREGAYPLMVAGLENLVALGLDPVADVILMRGTYDRLPEALAWLRARGVMRADLWFVSLTDGNRDNVASMPRLSEVVPFMARAFDEAREQGMRVRSLHVPRCLLGVHAEHAHDPATGGVRVVTPDDVFELEASKITPRVKVPACDACPERGRCRGLRPDYLERYGDEEVARARGLEPSIPPRRRLAAV